MAFAVRLRAGVAGCGHGIQRLSCSSVLTGTVQSMCLLAVSPDGNWLAASGSSAGVHVYNVKQLKVSMRFGCSKQEKVSPAVTRLRKTERTWKKDFKIKPSFKIQSVIPELDSLYFLPFFILIFNL